MPLGVVHGHHQVVVARAQTRENSVSAGSAPTALILSAWAAFTPGSVFSASSPWPNRPFSPACRLMAQTPFKIPRVVVVEAQVRRRSGASAGPALP